MSADAAVQGGCARPSVRRVPYRQGSTAGAAEMMRRSVPAVITLGLASRMSQAAVDRAAAIGALVSAAVVDQGGHLVHFQRMDRAEIAGPTLAVDKAFTAVAHQSTAALAALTQPGGGPVGGCSATGGGRFVVFGGGNPVLARRVGRRRRRCQRRNIEDVECARARHRRLFDSFADPSRPGPNSVRSMTDERVGRIRFMDEQPVNLDGFAHEDVGLGLVAMASPHDPVPSLVLREGRVAEMDGRAGTSTPWTRSSLLMASTFQSRRRR